MVPHALHDGSCRSWEVQRRLPGISKKMLTQTLREMDRAGLLSRPAIPSETTPLRQAGGGGTDLWCRRFAAGHHRRGTGV